MRVALDTNCFIDAVTPSSANYASTQKILAAKDAHRLDLFVSRHTLDELQRKPDSALSLARNITVLPHWPIGTWDQQVATWNQVEGTWAEAERNHGLQEELKQLAKSGNDIRDRGAYIDALHAKMDLFVTSDGQLVGSGPARRIEKRFGMRVVTPLQLTTEIT